MTLPTHFEGGGRPIGRRAKAILVTLSLASLSIGIGEGASVFLVADEQLVEGHIVFTTIHPTNMTTTPGDFAAAVAVLIRERIAIKSFFREPRVLWFNDQYLVNPSNAPDTLSNRTRYPCTGAVLAVNQGDPDPRAWGLAAYNAGSYVESYRVTDPNNRGWDIDKWNISGRFVWTVGILGSGSASSVPDNGVCSRSPVTDGAPSSNPAGGYRYPCGGLDTSPATSCAKIWYNALLFFYLDDLDVPNAPKNHTDGSYDDTHDVAGCHYDASTSPWFPQRWPCPAGDDDREGNSHPFNPHHATPAANDLGRVTHGYSDDCTGDGVKDEDCHATRRVDLYFGVAPVPMPRTYRFFDVEGSSAPYHCHKDPLPAEFTTDYCL